MLYRTTTTLRSGKNIVQIDISFAHTPETCLASVQMRPSGRDHAGHSDHTDCRLSGGELRLLAFALPWSARRRRSKTQVSELTTRSFGLHACCRRGKTLYLDLKRLAVLRTLWLTATYDYQVHNWFAYNSLMMSHFDVLLWSTCVWCAYVWKNIFKSIDRRLCTSLFLSAFHFISFHFDD